MKKQDLVDAIVSMHGEIRKLCDEAKIKEETYLKVIECLDEMKVEQLKVLYKKFNDFFSGAYRRARIIKDSLPEHVWQGYKDHGRHSLNEQIVLNERLKEMKQNFLIVFGFKIVKQEVLKPEIIKPETIKKELEIVEVKG